MSDTSGMHYCMHACPPPRTADVVLCPGALPPKELAEQLRRDPLGCYIQRGGGSRFFNDVKTNTTRISVRTTYTMVVFDCLEPCMYLIYGITDPPLVFTRIPGDPSKAKAAIETLFGQAEHRVPRAELGC